MKNLLLFLSIITLNASAQIVTKSIAADSNGVNQAFVITGFNVDGRDTAHGIIVVNYYIKKIGPNGKEVLPAYAPDFYKRFNQPQKIAGNDTIQANYKFRELMQSQLGQGIIQLFLHDLQNINSTVDIPKLKQ